MYFVVSLRKNPIYIISLKLSFFKLQKNQRSSCFKEMEVSFCISNMYILIYAMMISIIASYDLSISSNINLKHNSIDKIPSIYITDYGGDPTGTKDITTAFTQAINIASTYGAPNVKNIA